MEYIQFQFDDVSDEKKEILIALLADAGFEGFEEEGKVLKAFIPASEFKETLFNSITETAGVRYSKSIINETNWNAKWEADFEAIRVYLPGTNRPFAYIRAGFHTADTNFPNDIIVTPKMSFGTGHHPTTYLMVSQMGAMDFTNKSVIDFGTGTGVLAILAEKLGATSVIGIDYDDWSINNAKENLDVNKCSKTTITKADHFPAGIKADIILANINLNVIIANLAAIKNAANPGAAILFSGLLLTDEAHITQEIVRYGMQVKAVHSKENWIALFVLNI